MVVVSTQGTQVGTAGGGWMFSARAPDVEDNANGLVRLRDELVVLPIPNDGAFRSISL